ncbi:PBP1A family penicillin-binding protein [Pediococcus pentosaceus]|uniref:PBP1A family penicillin-binding protein n=1 Tax=Pediococcus pentosaceus TaxID=1255 RepID=UPI0020737DA1|nr:PBP1A family penicillin-binding protein [Pediococcus pentosaceus]MCI1295643.1 PBP1A family penicillin-binding protein [Pediococcus pentosaceus]MCM6793194.1 PBP1A family penicillin-binding protein [Pediococcus pentosaceus]MCM6811200.1 PBP1A family penicillin-binding protein [Pediococcus pentosaceus]MCM6817599.1 PBP1A family penicillin-binding protein [Pediococcus pentosaceus]MDN3206912.1 PBP1A family penicillin-binding protein [Pediococcus pentosaceus]
MKKIGSAIKAFLQKIGAFLKPVWDKIHPFIHKYWHRYQLTRWIIVVVLAVVFFSSAILTYQAKTANVKNLKAALSQPTLVYDKNNAKAGSLYSQKGTWTNLDNISPNVQNAVIATEDRNFYKEYGFSIKGIGRAFVMYGVNKLLGRDYISGGGSTLTQQLVKNAFLSQQQTFTRKAKELFLSIEVENVYSKKDILAMYLNNAYFGNGVWGVQDAAERYFGVSASELSVPQAATLAGMLTNPSGYNPIDHPKNAFSRRNVVLNLMAETGKISKADAKSYAQTAISTSDNYNSEDGYKYPYYFDAVIDEAISKYGLTESDIMNRGYKIYTYLDQDSQQGMQDTFDNSANFPVDATDGTKVQAASVAVNAKNGGVEAVVGGRGNHVFRGYNRATQIKRQPGSTLKPIAVYAPALASGYSYSSMLEDKLQTYGTNKYKPENYNNEYAGKIAMYQALEQSKNAPAVWLLNKIGVDKGYDYTKKFGLNPSKDDKNLAMALGGLTNGVSPIQLASAYTAFANNGTLSKTGFIRKIVDASGNTIVNNTTESKRVISKKVAKEMTSMMLGVYGDSSGTGYGAEPSGYTIAGKTGSTEADTGTSSSDATRDKWMVGYTKDVVVATWEGFDDTNKTHHLENITGVGMNSMFKSEMSAILPNTKGTSFDVKSASTLANSGNNVTSNVWDNIEDGTSSITDSISRGASGVKEKAGEFFNEAKKFITGN